jgi:type IV pilus assembly protein PilW
MIRSRGFTIIEFMIAMTLSLMVLAALTTAFVSSSRSRTEIERANEQIENGRFALQILIDDVETAGFYSNLDIDLALTADTEMPLPTAKPDPCATGLADLRAALPLHIQGYDNLTAAEAAALTCIADFKPDTDIVVIRRTATCVRGAANCEIVAGAPYFQASLCADHLDSLDYNDYFKLDTNTSSATMDRTKRNCSTQADLRQYLVHVYFIANNDEAGDGVPTLKRAELGNSADPDGFTIVPLARGIQDLQVDYGLDTGGDVATGDGTPDTFVSDPDLGEYNAAGAETATAANCDAHGPACIKNWRNVVALRLNVLARNSATTRDHTDSKVYYLGLDDDGDQRCALDANDDGTCEAFGDGFKRHVYQTSVRLNNPAARRDS